jgi:hypothetical protein
MGRFLITNRVSVWLIFISFSLTAVMMHPSGASLLVMFVNLAVLVALRSVALYEGKHPS